jgi:predicted 2-oxoglutarate/Fe(II)-dependent dioxygenase YbiX
MIPPEFFSKLGAYVVKGFLEPAACARIRDATSLARWRQATVGEVGTESVDDEIRRTRRWQLDDSYVQDVRRRLVGVQADLERHFAVSLSGLENPQFLGYRAGDFYRPHRDNSATYQVAPQIGRRRVSAVVFLNAPGSEHAGYEGGELVIYGLLGDERLASRGLPLRAEEGLLIAFRSEWLHGVNRVTRGERYSIATWFY